MVYINYTKWIAGLNTSMIDQHSAVNKTRNPVYVARKSYTNAQLLEALRQYTLFPKAIAGMLYAARDTCRAAKWHPVAVELTRNLGEELGTETEGVTHYVMLVQGLGRQLERDFSDVTPLKQTATFIEHIQSLMHNDPIHAAGAVYGLESSAVPELEIVKDLTEEACHRRTGQGIRDMQLMRFFKDHLCGWEPGHEDGLKRTLQAYITSTSARRTFGRGFETTITCMDDWWTGLDAAIRES